MNERLFVLPFNLTDPDSSAGLTTNAAYTVVPIDCTLVFVSAAPLEDDTGATVTIRDDTAAIASSIDASDHNVPGTWASTQVPGGTNEPVRIAAGSVISVDILAGAVANRFDVYLYLLSGSVWADAA